MLETYRVREDVRRLDLPVGAEHQMWILRIKVNGEILADAKCFKVLSARTVSSVGLGHLRSLASLVTISHRNISTTVPLQTKKRKQSKYQPRVPPFHFYGATHRLLRGASVTGERYGPIFDRPDYTYLDGRPTPLTPEQMKEKIERKDQAERVMRSLREMDEVKNYCAQKKRAFEHHKEKLTEQRLKAKS